MIGKDSYEVTTYRIDGAYEDSRHPKEVRFTNCLEEDLRRRDFTINAMAYNDDVRLVDVFEIRGKDFQKMHFVSFVRYASQHSWISRLNLILPKQ